MSFPSKAERTKCWTARDDYWKCLDEHAPSFVPGSGEKEHKQCVKLRKLFEQSCPGQWVKHFDRKRTYEAFKERMMQGYDPLDNKKPTT